LDTIYGKTFLVLGSQLALTWLSTVILLGVFRNLYYSKVSWIAGGINNDGNLDLDLDWETIKSYFWVLLGVNFTVFLILLFYGTTNLYLGIPLFSLWSILTGIELALCLISVDENLGGKVLALTTLITCAAGLVGATSGIDFSFLGAGLLISLLLLIIFGLIRIFFSIPRWIQRLLAFFGVVVFTGYLLYDFHRLSQLSEHASVNTWPAAVRISISIYLDIINLFLNFLDLLSK
jgi:FtsH-binding integral membrane protein